MLSFLYSRVAIKTYFKKLHKKIPISTAKYWIKNRVHLKLRSQILPNNGHRKLTDDEIKKIKEENFFNVINTPTFFPF